MKENNYNYFIDLLKFGFSLIIVVYHGWLFTGTFGYGYFPHGYLAVGFYYMVTGYLMMNTINKKEPTQELGKDTFAFLKNKIKKLLPYLLLSYLIGGIFIYQKDFFNPSILFSNKIIGEIIQLGSTGIGFSINITTWYISSMLIALLILYPLARKYKDNYTYLISPIILIILLTFIYTNKININSPFTISIFGQDGLYKAFIFIILGNYIYEIKKQIIYYKNQTNNKNNNHPHRTCLLCANSTYLSKEHVRNYFRHNSTTNRHIYNIFKYKLHLKNIQQKNIRRIR